jgi:hypothetical protein
VIEVTASAAAQWRLRADLDPARRERVEQITVRIIGATFLALAAYVAYESIQTLIGQEKSDGSTVGVVLLAASVIVMPLLARAKRRIASALGSSVLAADATQTSLCAYLSVIALAGVGLNTLFGWWWADPVSALAMVPIIAREGVEGLRGSECPDCIPKEEVPIETTIRCPECGETTMATMPSDACVFLWDCRACGVMLRPKPGDCCVFCSYSPVPCPSRRQRWAPVFRSPRA